MSGPGAVRGTVAATAVVLVASLAACAASDDPDPSPTASSAAATWDAPSVRSVDDAALAALRTWSRPDLTYTDWWDQLKPLLSPEAQQAYADTDPAQVPRLRIGDVEDRVNDDNPHLATVRVATDRGVYGVDLSRRDAGEDWLVESIVFPGGTSVFQ